MYCAGMVRVLATPPPALTADERPPSRKGEEFKKTFYGIVDVYTRTPKKRGGPDPPVVILINLLMQHSPCGLTHVPASLRKKLYGWPGTSCGQDLRAVRLCATLLDSGVA